MKFEAKDLPTPKEQWKWIPLATVDDLRPTHENTTSAAVRYGEDSQLAIFHYPGKGYLASQQMCPHRRAFVSPSLCTAVGITDELGAGPWYRRR